MKIITWLDLEGRYRVTSPAYKDKTRPKVSAGLDEDGRPALRDETEEECIVRVLRKIRTRYGLPDTHQFHLVEDADQRERLTETAGTSFRYGIFDTDARAGAWGMAADGRPFVNMAKARVIRADQIRVERNKRLDTSDKDVARLDGAAVPAGLKQKRQALRDLPATIQPDLDAITTPEALEAWEPQWPR